MSSRVSRKNFTLPTNGSLTVTSNSPNSGSILKLVRFVMTTAYDRPWAAWYDESGRLRTGLGYHSKNYADNTDHNRFEIKTSADPVGATPDYMKTAFYLSTNSDSSDASFGWLNRLYLDKTAYSVNGQFGISWRSPTSGNGTSVNVGQLLASLDASDNTLLALDPITSSPSKKAHLRLFRSTNTSGERRLIIYKGDGTTTETASLDAATGSLIINQLAVIAPTVPASATSAGQAGQIAWDSNYLYVCVATNTWKRSPLSSW